MVKTRDQQSGFAILLMVFVLLGLGLTGLSQVSGLHKQPSSGFTSDQYALQTARQSLLSYAALYPFHYGARGAGPGHLPCPDTDTVTMGSWQQSTGKDGPNPPCGSNAVASGQLPRHVNLGDHRYVFHVEPFQRLAYDVSSAVINNPVNRIVNDEMIQQEQTESPFLAWIRQTPVEQGRSTEMLSMTAISRQSLLPGVKQAVSAWFIGQAEQRTADTCSGLPEEHPDTPVPESMKVIWLLVTRDLAVPNQQMPEGVSESCEVGSIADLGEQGWQLEGVPLASHWFVRNQWHERIVVKESEPCKDQVVGVCSLMLDTNKSRAEPSDERLHFVWQLTS